MLCPYVNIIPTRSRPLTLILSLRGREDNSNPPALFMKEEFRFTS